MKTYEEIVAEYRKRQRDTVVDTLATGLTYMDEIAVDAIITVSEGAKIILKKKPGKTGVKDGAFRMVKTGAAMGVGAAVMGTAGFWAAIPVTMGVRALFDRYRSKALTGHRVQSRISRLRELNRFIRDEKPEMEDELPVRERIGFAAEGTVE